MTSNAITDRFESGAERYAAYLQTPEGRLRLDLAFANLQEFLPLATGSLRALDLGCGTGDAAVRLARHGIHVVLLDSSQAMLDFAARSARAAGVADRITLKHGDVVQVGDLFQAESFDVILCHNLLEFVDDPGAVLRIAAPLLRDSSAILSVMVRSQAGEVLKAAIQTGDLGAAAASLNAEYGYESLYGGSVRLFTRELLHPMLKAASLALTSEGGVRVLSDYLPPRVSREEQYQQIFDLERKLGRRAEFAAVARYTHCLARRTQPAMRNDA
jgi:S-adenosylmethionine-dependent methyltransferase